MMEQPAEVFQGVGDALQKMDFAFEEAAKTVSAERLQDANVDVGIKVLKERGSIKLDEAGEAVEIMIEELLAEFGRQVGFGVVQE